MFHYELCSVTVKTFVYLIRSNQDISTSTIGKSHQSRTTVPDDKKIVWIRGFLPIVEITYDREKKIDSEDS